MPDRDPNFFDLYKEMGGLAEGMRQVAQQLIEMRGEQAARHAENSRNITSTLQKLTEFKHQQLNHDQKVEMRLGSLEENTKRLKGEVNSLRKPVDQIVALRGRIGLFFTALLFFGGAVWFFLQPVWTLFYGRVISRFFWGGSLMPGINLTQLKYNVVEPTLTVLGLMSTSALNLVTGTAYAESGGCYLKQLGNGPALGLWQMEPATEQDCWDNFLKFRPDLAAKVRGLLAGGMTTPQLVWNLQYGAAMCRIKYYRAPDALPGAKDATAMAALHKRIYNSALGAADPALNAPLFQAAIDA